MKKIVIVSLMGYKGVGKDTFADNVKNFIDTHYKDVFCNKISLAYPIKKFVSKTFNISLEEIEDLKRKESVKLFNGLSVREVLVNVAENFKEICGVNIWADMTMNKIDAIISKNKNYDKFVFIVPDLRYMKEYESFNDFEYIYKNIQYLNIRLNLEGYKPFNLDKSEQEFLTIPFDVDITVTARNMFNDYVDLISKNIYLLLKNM